MSAESLWLGSRAARLDAAGKPADGGVMAAIAVVGVGAFVRKKSGLPVPLTAAAGSWHGYFLPSKCTDIRIAIAVSMSVHCFGNCKAVL